MKRPTSSSVLVILIVAPVLAVAVGPGPTNFTFQGFLSSDDAPVDGVVDLEARLFDSKTAGTQLGETQSLSNVAVTDGRFAVVLDFGDQYLGAPVWLELRVRPDGSSSFKTLQPRRRLRAAPHATWADGAATADLTVTAGSVGGKNASDLLDWTQMTGIPADLADGDDDTLGALSCTDGQLARWDGAAWGCGDDGGVSFGRTHVVGPVGDPVANGTALLAALAAIPTPGSAAEAWVLKIEPGRYDLGDLTLEMKPWVDVEGSGRSSTVITSEVCGSGPPDTGTVVGAADVDLRRITVENLCPETTATGVAVYSDADRLTLDDVLLRTAGAQYLAVGLYSIGDHLTVSGSVIRASSTYPQNGSYGIEAWTGGELTVRNVVAEGHGGNETSAGIAIVIDSPGLGIAFGARIEGCVFRVSNTSPTYFPTGVEILNRTSLEVSFSDSFVSASGPTFGSGVHVYTEGGLTRLTRVRAIGVETGITFDDSSPTQAQAIFTDVSATGSDYGIELQSNVSTLVSIVGGVITGSTASVRQWGGGEVLANLAHTRLYGPVALLPATSTCTAVTDAAPIFYASTCP